ncbi:med7-member of rna polymerase ii transcriptional regulation mediator complex [Trichoderma cornu-damae]|uniref:Mediator of RNA polymerase II transcription subunit 7 n=1 Tax=Trichoderma cornu-damae TaxID=654480 RepID=A0A9P8QUI5_9HYPO|nr:med7-member of rna polymerase ii transcriptional regulation mediator complex [Trichoderma cornu-damae]
MAEQQEPHSLASTFPNPPDFWKAFTPDKIAKVGELRRAHAAGDEEGADHVRIPDLPEDLMALQPPPEPADGRWRVFGDQYMVCVASCVRPSWHRLRSLIPASMRLQLDDKLPTLEEQGIENLPATGSSNGKDAKHYDRAFELKRLAKSLLLNFLELAGIMSRNPADAEAKIKDLRTIFINIHHILNEYRPHQARESAIEMMQDHLDRTRTETAAIRTQVDKARKVLEGLGSLDLSSFKMEEENIAVRTATAAARTREEEREAAAMEREAAAWATADALIT